MRRSLNRCASIVVPYRREKPKKLTQGFRWLKYTDALVARVDARSLCAVYAHGAHGFFQIYWRFPRGPYTALSSRIRRPTARKRSLASGISWMSMTKKALSPSRIVRP